MLMYVWVPGLDMIKCHYLSPLHRIFVNRSVSMDRIKYVGFDMDHTLVGKPLTSC